MTDIDDSTFRTLAEIKAERAKSAFGTMPQVKQPVADANFLKATPQAQPEVKKSKAKKKIVVGESDKFDEPNMTRRISKSGCVTYMVQIRRRVNGKQYSLSKTFRHLGNAKKLRNKRLLEIEVDGFPIQIVTETTIADVIQDRLTRGKQVGRSAIQNLKFIRDSEFGDTKVSTLTQAQLYDFSDLLLAGERSPQTVAGYMVHLAATLKWAKRRGALIPIAVVIDAMEVMWEDELLARSEERDRRPDLGELDKILKAIVANKRQKIPVATIMVFAIFSARRLGEICRLRWEDLKVSESKIWVREMKHPRKKKKNNVWCDLPPEALQIILSMPRTSEFIFPYNPRSVGAAFRRHRDKVGVIDLRFHDLRHDAISRLSEMGILQSFVAKTSGHKGESCLERYTHVEKVGDKYADWPWLAVILNMNGF
ncbi:site-specific integrase [Celeribacter arenosi]|uniref:Site-specific integrase n=1 Tax=Celeribacter arenosi TaxID=792649 RepID=A0ABP7KES2_9RHOB